MWNDSQVSSSSRNDSPQKYSLKVMERKLNGQTEWAELVRQQQILAEQMIQKEKERKLLQKMEMSESLNALINEKQNNRKSEETMTKQQEYQQSMARKQEYDQYILRVKNNKDEVKKNLSSQYEQDRLMREEEKRRQVEYEKQLEQKMVNDALVSLEREKQMKEMKRNQFIQSIEDLRREKDAQKRQEQEREQQERQQHNQYLQQNAQRLEQRNQNYKQYYQRVDERQNNLLQAHHERVAQPAKSKEREREDFINRGIEEARRRADEQEAENQRRKQEQLRSLGDDLRTKINEKQETQWREKMSYRDKVEELMRHNIEIQEFDEQQKRKRANQTNDYKNTLELQIREAEDNKLKVNTGLGMSESEKKFHLNQFNGLIPGLKSDRLDALVSPQMRSSRPVDFYQNALRSNLAGSKSYVNIPSYKIDVNNNSNNISGASLNNSITSPNNNSISITSPTSATNQNNSSYNPITNPIPNNLQNPYLIKEYQREKIEPKHRFAVIANRNL